MTDDPSVEVRSRSDLRGWLEANHDTAGTHWLIRWKKGTDHHLSWGDMVSELLCWGWIDSVPRKVDAERTATRISPRSPGSAWSAINKEKVAEARADGSMTPAGEATIARAEANGMWGFLDDVERLEVPEDLAEALGTDRAAWDEVPASLRRGTLEWLKRAKRDATRAGRIERVVDAVREGRKPPPA